MPVKMFVLGIVMPLRDRWLGARDTKLRIRYGGSPFRGRLVPSPTSMC